MIPSSITKRRSASARSTLRTGALLLALVPMAATLSSCGFDYPTDRVNTIAAGTSARGTSVEALGMRILASSDGHGRLIGSIANNNDDTASLSQIGSPGGNVTAPGFSPIEVEGGGLVNLSDLPAIKLAGEFAAGEVVPVDLTFSTGESTQLRIPVVKRCYQYTQLPSVAAPSDGEAAEKAPDDAASEGEGEAGGDATYNCSDQAPVPEGAH